MGVGLAAVGTGFKVFGAVLKKQQAESVARFNESAALLNAEATRAAGAEEQFQQRQARKQILARNRALTAAGGVQQIGSPIQAQLTVIDDFATNIGAIGFNTEIAARDFEQQAEIARMQRRQAATQGLLEIGSALIGGGTDLLALSPLKTPGTVAAQGSVREEEDITARKGTVKALPAIKTRTIKTRSGRSIGTLRGRKPKRKGAFAGTNKSSASPPGTITA